MKPTAPSSRISRRALLSTAAALPTLSALVVPTAANVHLNLKIIFDSMGAQVQVQNQTKDRLTTWTNALKATYVVKYTNWKYPIAPRLRFNDVFIITTHQYTSVPLNSTPRPKIANPIPADFNFGYSSSDLGGILSWVKAGGGLLLFVNHSNFPDQGPGPYWPINDIQLAAALGITTVFAAIPL